MCPGMRTAIITEDPADEQIGAADEQEKQTEQITDFDHHAPGESRPGRGDRKMILQSRHEYHRQIQEAVPKSNAFVADRAEHHEGAELPHGKNDSDQEKQNVQRRSFVFPQYKKTQTKHEEHAGKAKYLRDVDCVIHELEAITRPSHYSTNQKIEKEKCGLLQTAF